MIVYGLIFDFDISYLKKNKLFNPSGTKIDIGILLEMISDMWRISDILAVLTGARIKLHK